MADIFLSYSSNDRSWIQGLAKSLEVMGWTTWWDRKTPIGKSYHDILEEEIDAAKCVVVVWTHSSVSSDWVRTEAEEGKRRNILVPAILGQPRIPLGFRHLQAANLDGWAAGTHNSEFDALVSSIHLIAPLQAHEGTSSPKETHQKAASVAVAESKKRRSPGTSARKKTPTAAFMNAMTPSEQLAAIIGNKPLPRTEVTKKVWEYIKKHGLQDKTKNTQINADDKLLKIFEGQSSVSMFEMTKLLSKHLK